MPDAPILKYEKVPVNVILVLKKVFDFVHKLCKYVCIFMVGVIYIFCLPPACSSMIIITVLRPGRFSVVAPITLIEIVAFACCIINT